MIGSSSRWAVAVLVLLGMLGCKELKELNPAPKAPVQSMKETYQYLGVAAQELQATNAALDRLTTTSDLPGWLKEFSRSIVSLEKAGADAKDRWANMKANSAAYIEHWDKEIAETKNPQIQETMEQRRQRVTAKFENIRSLAEKVRDAYPPYLQDLKDIEKALTVDLTPNGAKALGPAVAEAKAGGEVIMKNLDQVGIELDQLTGKLSPK